MERWKSNVLSVDRGEGDDIECLVHQVSGEILEDNSTAPNASHEL